MGIRSSLYKIARLMGDINAVQKGKVGKRVAGHAAVSQAQSFHGRM